VQIQVFKTDEQKIEYQIVFYQMHHLYVWHGLPSSGDVSSGKILAEELVILLESNGFYGVNFSNKLYR
jgi:hypothetical protein